MKDSRTRRLGAAGTLPIALLLLGLAVPGAARAADVPNGSVFAPGPEAPAGTGLDWAVVSLNAIGCANDATQFTTQLSGFTGGDIHFRTVVDSGGLRYMDEDAGVPGGGNGQYGWHLYDSNSGGPTTASFPLAPDLPVTVDFGLIQGSGGPYVFLRRVTLSQCNGGTITGDEVLIEGRPHLLEVPTLSPAGLALLGCALLAGAAWALRRRRAA